MNKTLKKAFSILLAVLLCLSGFSCLAAEEKLTKAQLTAVINAVIGKETQDTSDDAVSRLTLAKSIIDIASAKAFSIRRYIKAVILAVDIIFDAGVFGINGTVTRGEAAVLIKKAVTL